MTLYRLPHLDLIVSLSCHSLNLTCTRLGLRNPVSTPLGSLGTAPIHSSRSCTLLQLGVVPFPSTLLLAFGHCLCIILYKPRLCSTRTSVQISCCVISSRLLVTMPLCLYPCPPNSTCPLNSLTQPSHLFPLSRCQT